MKPNEQKAAAKEFVERLRAAEGNEQRESNVVLLDEFDKVNHSLPVSAKQEIARRHFDEIYESLDADDKLNIDASDIAGWFQDNAEKYDNMRIMKTKIDRTVFGRLTDRLLADIGPGSAASRLPNMEDMHA